MDLHVKPYGVNPQRVEQARREAGLSQVELAVAIGCSPRAVQYWESNENGARQMRSRYMRSLAQVTGKPIAWFFEENGA